MPATPVHEQTALVRDLLAHIHDYGYCQAHPLTAWVPERAGSRVERMRILRQAVLEAMETMRPRPGAQPTSPAARSYQVLRQHYVEGRLLKEIAFDFSVSPRQVYRYLRKAEEDLTALLHARLSPNASQSPSSTPNHESRAQLLQVQADRLSSQVEPLSLDSMVAAATEFVSRLALDCNIDLRCSEIGSNLTVLANAQLLRHALLNALSHCVKQAPEGSSLQIGAHAVGSAIEVVISGAYLGGAHAELPDEVRRLVSSAGGDTHTRIEGQRVHHTLTFRDQARQRFLVIDDNAGMGELVRRYLTDSQFVVSSTTDGREGLRQAIESPPNVILLDVLLADEDGWQILQQLLSTPETAQIPVIVCSVFNDPELAHSLGATAFLTKPLRRPQLLSALAAVATAVDTRGETRAARP